MVKAGERVLIYEGVYREKIRPKNEGKGPDQMISYEGVPGAKVIVKGSRVLHVDWVQRRVYTDELPDSSLTLTWSRKLWMASIPDTIFEEGYYPLRLPNILPEEFDLMPWANPVKQLSPYNSTRALLFQNGRRMTQLEDYGDLKRLSGSFWVDVDGKTVHIHPFGSGNPINELFEIGVQSHLLKPQQIGMGYIQVRGITFEHCANGFLRTSTGAVTILGWKNSKAIRASVQFTPKVMHFSWRSAGEVPKVPTLEELKFDFFKTARNGELTVPGPFSMLDQDCELLLNEMPK